MKYNRILKILTNSKPIGRGSQAETYLYGKYVLRVPLGNVPKIINAITDGVLQINKTINAFPRHNFGQALYVGTDGHDELFSINKFVSGIATNDLVDENLSDSEIARAQRVAIKKMKMFANAPMSSYRALVRDLNYLESTPYVIDPCEGNMLYDAATQRFRIIDLRPNVEKRVRGIGDLILLLLTDIPNMPANKQYYDLEIKIVSDLIVAAHSVGVVKPEQLKCKNRVYEVLKSDTAKQIYKDNFYKFSVK